MPNSKMQLKLIYRVMLKEQPLLRYKIASDMMINERTIFNWAQHNSPKLTAPSFIDSLKKHTKASVDLTELVPEETASHLHE